MDNDKRHPVGSTFEIRFPPVMSLSGPLVWRIVTFRVTRHVEESEGYTPDGRRFYMPPGEVLEAVSTREEPATFEEALEAWNKAH